MKFWSHTVKGRKAINEDYLLHHDLDGDRYLWVVADGMGGYYNGEIAAKIVAENMLALVSSHNHVDQRLLQISINKANLALRQLEQISGRKSGSTIGGIYIEGDKAICFWVGDVKILYFRNNKLFFESKSHSLINELQDRGLNFDSSIISNHRHIITNSIQGDVDNPKADYFLCELKRNIDEIVICSDGYPFDKLVPNEGVKLSNNYIKSLIQLDSGMDDTSYFYINFNEN